MGFILDVLSVVASRSKYSRPQITMFTFINAIVSILSSSLFLGRGVFATRQFQKNDFICTYQGKLFKKNEIKNLKGKLPFVYDFMHDGKQYW